MYLEVGFLPGIHSNGTDRENRPACVEGNLVRWGPTLQPVLGWQRQFSAAFTPSVRALLPWRDNADNRWIAAGSHGKLEVASASGTISNITPVGFSAGRADAATGSGYGTGAYGTGSYGTPRPDTSAISPATVWDLDLFGQNLVGNSDFDGKLYQWTRDVAVKAAVVSGAPTGILGLCVDADNFVFVYKGRRISWCDQADITTWTAAATNQAGDQDLNSPGVFLTGRRVRGGTLHFSTNDVWLSTYQGPPAVFGFQQVGDGCGIVSKGAAAAFDGECVWWGKGSFFQFNQGVSPIPCDVYDDVFGDWNETQASKITAHYNPKTGEACWDYPSASSTENDRCVVLNVRTREWRIDTLSRTAGAGPGTFDDPLRTSADGHLYAHENGFAYDGAFPYVLTAPIELGSGDSVMRVLGFVPDEKTQGDVRVSFLARPYPNGALTTYGPYSVTGSPVDVRLTARQVQVKAEFVGGDDARLGGLRLDVRPGGRR